MRASYLVVFLILVSGCAGENNWLGRNLGHWHQNKFKVGPEYSEPCPSTAEDWIEGYDDLIQNDLPACDRWWFVFDDPVLDLLMEETYGQNLTLKAAGFRILQARAVRGISIGEFFPQTQQLTADYLHNQDSQTTLGATGAAPGKRGYDFWSTGINLVWELDFWGKFRRQIESADANLDATISNYDDVLVILLSDTASAYVEYRTIQERLRLANANIKIQAGSLKIAQDRFDAEVVSKLDVTQALTNLERTNATIPQLELSLRNAMLRLCTLTGRPPQDLADYLGTSPIPDAPAEVAVGIPADLIRRRPDVRRAEREVAAQSAQIGVAVAEIFPSFSLSGFLGWDSENLSSLFKQASFAGFIGAPTVNWNVLNYGRIKNNVLLQDAGFQELVMLYRQKVIDAGAEAEQAIAGFLRTQEQTEILQRAVIANQESVQLANIQYSGGFIDFNRVFTVQGDLVLAQDQLAVAQGDIALSLIAIYKSLGCGWEIRCQPSPTLVADSNAMLSIDSDNTSSLPFEETGESLIATSPDQPENTLPTATESPQE